MNPFSWMDYVVGVQIMDIRRRNQMENKYCPLCGRLTLSHVEDCHEDEVEVKTAWICTTCKDMVVYIVEFKEATDE